MVLSQSEFLVFKSILFLLYKRNKQTTKHTLTHTLLKPNRMTFCFTLRKRHHSTKPLLHMNGNDLFGQKNMVLMEIVLKANEAIKFNL